LLAYETLANDPPAFSHTTCGTDEERIYIVLKGQEVTMDASLHHKVVCTADSVTCSCRRNDGMACVHIIYMMKKLKRMPEFIDPVTLTKYTHPCYTVEYMKAMYSGYILPCTEVALAKSGMLPPSADVNYAGSKRIRSGANTHTGNKGGISVSQLEKSRSRKKSKPKQKKRYVLLKDNTVGVFTHDTLATPFGFIISNKDNNLRIVGPDGVIDAGEYEYDSEVDYDSAAMRCHGDDSDRSDDSDDDSDDSDLDHDDGPEDPTDSASDYHKSKRTVTDIDGQVIGY
jgi:hypothetical protein